MIQLVANGNNGDVFLDLYEQDPIKLTFNIEDTLDVAVQSEYTRQFRVPATLKNTNFFESAFEINGQDFDVTVRREARILIGGAEFRKGEIRLQKIYKNEPKNIIDYEIIFLGSTKNLGTSLGNKTINDLDLSSYIHDLNYTNVSASWQAFPQGGLTDGLFNGDIVYPLVDFGNRYAELGGGVYGPLETRIAVGSGIHFTQNLYPTNPLRFRPMMRVKTIIDKIFDESGYEYTSSFLDSNEAQQMYLSSWGDDAIVSVDGTNANLAKVDKVSTTNTTIIPAGAVQGYALDSINFDYNSNVVGSPNNYTSYQVPVNGDYTFKWDADIRFIWESTNFIGTQWQYEIASGPAGQAWRFTGGLTSLNEAYVNIEVDEGAGYTVYGEFSGPVISPLGVQQVAYVDIQITTEETQTLTAGTTVDMTFNWHDGVLASGISIQYLTAAYRVGTSFEVLSAPGAFSVNSGFNSNYKQLDFLKDIFKLFRLVLVPDPGNPNLFQIEPWQFYIGTGEVKDWTPKMDLSKDIVIEPLVSEQTDRLVLAMAEDEDWLNKLNQEQFKETFGTAIVDSPYETLEGEKKIEVGIAPTPATQIQGYFGDSPNWDNIIIPQVCTNEIENETQVFKPIKPKPRILFYNGLESSGTWYFEDNGGPTYTQNSVPIASYYSSFLPQPNTKILNFQKENGYDQEDVINTNYGQDLYNRYWSEYINLVYDKYSRRLTAYFVLDDYDLVNFKYSDVIFVKDTYFYIEKIYDAPLGKRDKIKVDLIKLPNYRPNVGGFVPVGEYWEDITQNWEAIATLWEQL